MPATDSMPSTVADPEASANAANVTRSAGSRKAAIVISRLAPIPPKALAESSPAKPGRPRRASRIPATITRCDSGAAAPPRPTSGSTAADSIAVDNTAKGAARNTHDVLDDSTISLRISVRIVQ